MLRTPDLMCDEPPLSHWESDVDPTDRMDDVAPLLLPPQSAVITCRIHPSHSYRMDDAASPLGTGTYGRVVRATRTDDPTQAVAIKCIRHRGGEDDNVDALVVQRELSINMLFRRCGGGSHILHAIGWARDDTRTYLVLPLCSGGTLFDRFIRRGPTLPLMVRSLMRQLLDAVATCHALGIMHRDIKPQNCMISEEAGSPVLKLGDFGLARQLGPHGGTTVGGGGPQYSSGMITLWYRAPEVLRCDPYGTEVDTVVRLHFGELATGLPMYPGRDEADQLRRLLSPPRHPPDAALGERGTSLLRRMLDMSAVQRISCRDAMRSDYFVEEEAEDNRENEPPVAKRRRRNEP